MVDLERELRLLEEIEQNPETTQADLAARLGVAVGTVNWYLKRLIKKGYVKVKQLQRRRLRYLITPQGIAEKAKLTAAYLEVSMRLYRETREEARRLLAEVRGAGYDRVWIEGDSDLADVCRLTCLEQGVKVERGRSLPVLRVEGTELIPEWPLETSCPPIGSGGIGASIVAESGRR